MVARVGAGLEGGRQRHLQQLQVRRGVGQRRFQVRRNHERVALNERVEIVRAENDGRGLLLRGRFFGRGSVHADLQRPDALIDLLREVQADAQGFEPFVWWTAIRDESQSDLNRDAISLRGDFSAELIAVSDAAADDLELRQRLLGALELPPSLRSALKGFALEEPDWAALIADADEVALDLLETGGPK